MGIVEFTVEKVLDYVIDLIAEPIMNTVVNKVNEKNNIIIFINGNNNESPFSINMKKSTKIDFEDWHKKLELGGDIEIRFDYLREVETYMKNKKSSISEKESKEIYEGVLGIKRKGEILRIMLKNSILERNISDKIQFFSVFVNAAIDKCFQFIKGNNCVEFSDYKTLKVYDTHDLFSFQVSADEYDNILKKSEGKIEIDHYLSFNEFMAFTTDRKIMENEIIPLYLLNNAIREISEERKMPIRDFSTWWISID